MADTTEWALKLPSGKLLAISSGTADSGGLWCVNRSDVEKALTQTKAALEMVGAVDQTLTVCKRTRSVTFSAPEDDEVIVVGATVVT